jgi:hypothetical protein
VVLLRLRGVQRVARLARHLAHLRARFADRDAQQPGPSQGVTGCTRGPPSSRSVAWYAIRPSIRYRAKAAGSGSVFANSSQVAATDAA